MMQPWWTRSESTTALTAARLLGTLMIAGLAWAGVKLYAHPPASLTGTYYGTYTMFAGTPAADAIVLHLVQSGNRVSGSLKSEQRRRTATFAGETHDDRLTGTLTFTDRCGGSATVTLVMIDHARRLDGSYEAHDCAGTHWGELAVLYYWR